MTFRGFPYFIVVSTVLLTTACSFQNSKIVQEENRLRTAVRIHPGHELGYLRLSQFLEQQSRYDETLAVLQEGQRRVPESILMIRLEGSLYQTLGDDQQILDFYQNLIRQHPNEAVLLLDRARWHWYLNRPEDEMADLERVFVLVFERFEAHYLAGMIHLRNKEDVKALKSMIAAARIQEGHAKIWSHIAYLWHRQGDTLKARSAIRKALEL